MKKEVNIEEINSSPKRGWQGYNENIPNIIIGLIVAAIGIGVVVYSSWVLTIIITAVGGYLVYFISAKLRKAAVESLLDKYKDQAIVDRIMNDEYWMDMTEDMLFDSLGSPGRWKDNVRKERVEITYFFRPFETEKGKTMHKLKVEVVNDLVAGWEDGRF